MTSEVSQNAEFSYQLWSGTGGNTAWEIGANVGQTVSKLLELFQHVECFEPSVESFTMLALNFVDTPGVKLHRFGLSDHDGVLETSIREIAIQSGSLVSTGIPYDEQGLPWGKEIATREVLCRSIDSLVKTQGVPDFCSVDTEGYEADILRGAAEVLDWGKISWLIEFHAVEEFEECMKLLHNAGYEPEIIRNPQYKRGGFLWENHGWVRAIGLGI